jgi:5'-3' exonuclease
MRRDSALKGKRQVQEKLLLNYIRSKALETVSSSKSSSHKGKTLVPSSKKSGKQDVFELPPLPVVLLSETEENLGDIILDEEASTLVSDELMSQVALQDLDQIDINSDSFKALPLEIQHELIIAIQDKNRVNRWNECAEMPQEACSFSNYQLGRLLERGRLTQQLEAVRKSMNSRQTGAASNLISNDISGLDEEMISQRVVSEDQAHFILIKGGGLSSKEDSQDSQVESDYEKATDPKELQEHVDISVIPSSNKEDERNDCSEGQKTIDYQIETAEDSLEFRDTDSQHVQYDSQPVTSPVKHRATIIEDATTAVVCNKEDVQTSSDEFIEVQSESDEVIVEVQSENDKESMERAVTASDLFPPFVFQRVTRAGECNPSDIQIESSEKDLNITGDIQSINDVTIEENQLSGKAVLEETNTDISKIDVESQVDERNFQFVASKEDAVEVANAMQDWLAVEQSLLEQEQAQSARYAAEVTNQMYADGMELLRLFGVPYIQAPMEAEAQCAWLDQTEQTDGTITDDSDIFLVGGRRVFKNLFNQNKYSEVYRAEDIESILGLDRQKMVDLALLLGSDYTPGIQGVGAVAAMEILGYFNGENDWLRKLRDWWEKANADHIITPKESRLERLMRTLDLPPSFPDNTVQQAYMLPTVDESREPFQWAMPDLDALRDFAKTSFNWSKKRVDELLLPVMHQLNSKEVQLSINRYMVCLSPQKRKVKSRRLQQAIAKIVHSQSSSDCSDSELGSAMPASGSRVQQDTTVVQITERDNSHSKRPRGKAKGRGRGRGRGREKGGFI